MISRSLWDNDKLYNDLYQITKDKQKKFKENFISIKEKKIFDFNEQKLLTKNSFFVIYIVKKEKSVFLKQTGFSTSEAGRQSGNLNSNPFTFKNPTTNQRKELLSSLEYNPLRASQTTFHLQAEREFANNDNDFKKSFQNQNLKKQDIKKQDRYSENSETQIPKTNLFKNSFPQSFQNNVGDILNNLEEPNRSNFSVIQSFLKIEKSYIDKELLDLKGEKVNPIKY
jgi:hypothetical protein